MKKVVPGFFELCIHIVVYAFVIYLIYRAAIFAYDFSYQVFGDPVMSEYSTQTSTIVVEEGDSVSDIAEELSDAGLIKYQLAFVLRVQLEDMGDSIMTGTFELSPSMSAEEILEILTTEGDSSSASGEEITK